MKKFHKIHHFRCTVIFSKFTKLHDNHHHLVSEHFQQPYKVPGAHLQSIIVSVPSILQPQAAINLLSVFRDLSFLDTSFKWNHTMGGLLHLASFTEHNVFEAHLCCSMSQYFISLYC